jgi:hypothetical protein
VLIRRKLKRRYVLTSFQKLPPCLVGIEACATSHHWSRELEAGLAGVVRRSYIPVRPNGFGGSVISILYAPPPHISLSGPLWNPMGI